jgi:NAD(P)-dependent dehydrogenase (short-subunit alcohol dehydrogenase family)
MSKHEAIIRSGYAAAEGGVNDVKTFVSLFAADGVILDVASGTEYRGQDLGRMVDVFATAFPDMHRDIHHVYGTQRVWGARRYRRSRASRRPRRCNQRAPWAPGHLFANAGTGELLPLGAMTEAHVDRIFGVNVKGTLFTVQKALPLMPAGSAIVINGSMAASKGMPAFSVYAASKAALRSFARGWSVELKDRGIRVNVVAPGTIITPGYKTAGLSEEQIQGFAAQASAAAALGRTGTEDEAAKAVSFLASDDASYITGIELFVDGGTAQI